MKVKKLFESKRTNIFTCIQVVVIFVATGFLHLNFVYTYSFVCSSLNVFVL